MSENIVIGKILKAQGIKGEIKVSPITNDIVRFKKLKNVFIGENNQYEVESTRIDSTFAYIKLKEINNRNDAEILRNQYISIDRKDAVKLPEGSYFVVDLIGCKVVIDNEIVGELTDVYDYTGSVDTYEVTLTNGGQLLFPALKVILKNIDISNKLIELDKKRLDEVAIYED